MNPQNYKKENEIEPQVPLIILLLTSLIKCVPIILIYVACYFLFKAQREIVLIFATIPLGIFALWKNKNILGYILGRKVDGYAITDIILFFCLLLGFIVLLTIHFYFGQA